jgi:hypothetical protein
MLLAAVGTLPGFSPAKVMPPSNPLRRCSHIGSPRCSPRLTDGATWSHVIVSQQELAPASRYCRDIALML